MARSAPSSPPRLSLFDRLLQGDSIETDRNADSAMRQLRESVRRDLEILLNTRPARTVMGTDMGELAASVLSYGLPGLQNQNLATPTQQEAFRKQLETIIQRFEPRFRELEVELVDRDSSLDRTLRFRMRAVLQADGASEAVVYDTVVDPATGGLRILA
ncbi:type VI secretion system baseplate subunit TssE [Mesorhizobium sp. 1B3]|uniref:type VI secretion system baseplate subunit TssE n=1 Tax=Mesorhizobium sp. 1B3 TaxID=3243599 RepID=UPI003D97707D